MIQQKSKLKVSDNSGAKTVRCIKVLGGFKKKIAKIGDLIVVSVQNLRNKMKYNSKVKKKEVYRALIIRTKNSFTKKSGFISSFFENSVVLINKQGNPLGTRIIGPVPRILKKKTLQKVLSISSAII
jgi:large subunit ribosomal protein L14|uniref:Ribosomal protein L14 n=1 Tax=Didymosphenia geminata TaxID=1115533 RepID=A0A1L4BMC9_9STRA|nr:ribosomal protein L14 [Didymosphenia geminata]API83116.1 ribosomal protein L14 [Didymosphenia geminata]